MAATLVLSENAKREALKALKEDLTHVFLGNDVNNDRLGITLSNTAIQSLSSDGSSRVKQLRLAAGSQTVYRSYNDLVELDENRITNFYIRDGIAVKNLFLMNSAKRVMGIITFNTITPDATKSLYVPEIKITVL